MYVHTILDFFYYKHTFQLILNLKKYKKYNKQPFKDLKFEKK
jgi:hypothetical protein